MQLMMALHFRILSILAIKIHSVYTLTSAHRELLCQSINAIVYEILLNHLAYANWLKKHIYYAKFVFLCVKKPPIEQHNNIKIKYLNTRALFLLNSFFFINVSYMFDVRKIYVKIVV